MPAERKPRRRSTLGEILPTGNRFRARYERFGQRHTPGRTFTTFALADQWLADEQRLIDRDEWTPPSERRAVAQVQALTFGEYAEEWIEQRMHGGKPLKARTAEHYRSLRDQHMGPLLDRPLAVLSRAECSEWYYSLPQDKPTTRQHCYALARSIMRSAVKDGLIPTNPVDIDGASAHQKAPDFETFTAEQVARMADLMPPRHRLMVLLAAWCGLRFGELAGLRRSDFTTDKHGTMRLKIQRAVVTVGNRRVLDTTKSDAGRRTVVVPSHIIPDVEAHLKPASGFAQWGRDGLVFPPAGSAQEFITPGQVYGSAPKFDRTGRQIKTGHGFYLARHEVGRDDLSFHKLRHFAGTTHQLSGATLEETRVFMGHSDVRTTMIYQHAAASRAVELAERMSQVAQLGTKAQGAQ